MRRLFPIASLAVLLAGAARADLDAGPIRNFGPNLKDVCDQPEGIAVDPQGFVYASSFAFQPTASICVLSPAGQVVRVLSVAAGPGGVASLLGMLYVPGQGLYVVDFANGAKGNGRLLLVEPATGAVTVLASGFSAPNAIAQDRHKDLYVSDSFEGRIYRVARDGSVVVWAEDVRLLPAGNPPFGANGLAFDRDERFLYVAQTSTDSVFRFPVLASGEAGPMELFASAATIGAPGALDGADGLQIDVHGNVWVCANQANEVQVLSPSGALVARLAGTGADALDFPASLVFRGRSLYLTNLSLADGGVNSKLSVLEVPWPGLPLRP